MPVREPHVKARHHLLYLVRNHRDVVGAVVNVVDLAAPAGFPEDRLADRFIGIFHDVGLDRHPVDRRLGEQAHVPDPCKAHVERPRDRRRAERKDVDVLPQLLDLLFMAYAETLFLVNYQKAQIFELNVCGEQAVGSDHDVGHAGLHFL